jgi:enoyl-[acyl-carrier protein] reductase I
MSGISLHYLIWHSGVFSDYNDMADNKAYLESIARSFGYSSVGIKVRVNTISQSQRTKQVRQLKGFKVLLL